jgi:hypothetical protein
MQYLFHVYENACILIKQRVGKIWLRSLERNIAHVGKTRINEVKEPKKSGHGGGGRAQKKDDVVHSRYYCS